MLDAWGCTKLISTAVRFVSLKINEFYMELSRPRLLLKLNL